MAIRFLSGQTIDGNLTVSGNVQAATFNSLPIATGRNNQANKIVRTQGNGYVDFGWINSTSGNHTGSITRITASNDEYLRYVTPAQFRTNVTDGYYAPASTVSGVTSVTAGNGLAGGTITSTGTLSTVHLPSFDTRNSNPDPEDYANLIRFDFKHNSTNGLSDGGSYNGQMTWRSYGSGSDMSGGLPIRLAYTANGNLYRQMGTSATSWGDWNKFALATGTSSQYIRGDGSIATFPTITGGTVTSVATGNGLTGGTITSTGTLTMSGSYTGNFSVTGDITADQVITTNNGSGQNYRIGDDAWIGDINIANTFRISGNQNGANGYITFGNSSNTQLGRAGTGALTWGGDFAITGGLSVQGNNIFGMGISTGSWYGDLGSHGYTRETGLAMTGGSEFVVLSKSGQGSVLVDGAYLAYESANGFFGSYNSSYGNLTGIQATGANTIAVKQLDGGTANLTITENLQVTGAMYQDVSSTGGYIVKPKGADFFTASNVQTGAIEIRFPTGGSARDDMVFFTVDVYQYNTNRSFSIKAGGYIYQGIGGTTWINVFAQVYAKNSNQNYTVRFGDNGSTHCMWIGESTDSWSYSQIVVRDFFGGYATDIDQYKEGWDITFDSLSGKTINNTLTNNFPLAQDIISGAYLPLSGGTMSGNIQMLSNSLQFDQSGTRSWAMNAASGNLFINSGDGLGNVSLNCGLIVADTLTASSRIIIQSRNDNTNVGTINSTNNQSDWQNLVASSGQFTVTQYNNISNYTNAPSGVYTYGSVLSTRTANHSFQLYSAHTGDLCYKTQWNNDNYSGWRGIPVYGANSGSPSTKDLYATRVYDSNNTAYYIDPDANSVLTTATFNLNANSTISLVAAGTNASQIKAGAGDELYLGGNNTWQMRLSGGNILMDNGGYALSNGSMRAPVFYDSANTAYYGDFGSTTTSLSTAGKWVCQGGHSSARMQLNYQHSATDSGNSGALTGWVSEPGITYNSAGIGGNINVSGQYYGRQYNSGYGCYVRFDKNNGNVEHWTTTATAGNAGGQGTRRWYNDASGNAFASSSSRAPIFYDNNNTGYYGDFAATSQLNVLNCAGTLTVTGSSGVVAPKFTDYNNGAFYLDPANTSTSLNVAGDVVAYASSDIRFKNNVTPITNALDKLSKIGGYTFDWNEISHKETGKKDIGVIAQEVEEILPEIVQTRSNGYKAVDYQKLTALLIESVKEQQFIIDDLKSRIERLEKF